MTSNGKVSPRSVLRVSMLRKTGARIGYPAWIADCKLGAARMRK